MITQNKKQVNMQNKSIQATVRIAGVQNLSTDESRESKCGEAAIIQPILIQVPNVDLD